MVGAGRCEDAFRLLSFLFARTLICPSLPVRRIGYEFEGYDLVFCCFEKIGWVEEGVDKRKK